MKERKYTSIVNGIRMNVTYCIPQDDEDIKLPPVITKEIADKIELPPPRYKDDYIDNDK